MNKIKEDAVHSFSKIDLFLLTIILLTALLFRLYKINTPLADFHSWRQVDTSAVTRNFVKNGVDLMHPKYDDLSSIETGKENPEGFRFVEFPLYNAIVAVAYRYFPLSSLEIYGRLTSIFFSLIIISVIYFIALKEKNRLTAFFASITYAIMPFFVFFSRVVLPDTSSLSFIFLSIFFLYCFAGSSKKKSVLFYLLSLIFFILGILVKPPAIFYGISLIFIFFSKYKWTIIKKPQVYAYFILGIIPLFLWRTYIQQFPEGVPASDWLITSVNTYQGLQNIFFKPAFFRWIFFERINNIILGGYLTSLLMIGILNKSGKYILYGILLSSLAYLFTFQGGNVQHEYYQIFILPALALFIGIGTSSILQNKNQFINPLISLGVIAFLFGFSFFISYYSVRNYYNYPDDLPQIAKVIQTLSLPTDKIVTDRTGDTTLLYLSNRKGAPAIYKDPEELKQLGYNYLVTQNEGEIKSMKIKKFMVVFENNSFAMFAL